MLVYNHAYKEVLKYRTSKKNNTMLFWYGPYSQWWKSDFTIDGITYNCAEQYMMAKKAEMFGDINAYNNIMQPIPDNTTQDIFFRFPKRYKSIGRQVDNFDPIVWSAVAKDIVFRGNTEKFIQNEDLLVALAASEQYLLVEASPFDKLWGAGIGTENDDAFDPSKWKGKNWLGQIITEVRSIIL